MFSSRFSKINLKVFANSTRRFSSQKKQSSPLKWGLTVVPFALGAGFFSRKYDDPQREEESKENFKQGWETIHPPVQKTSLNDVKIRGKEEYDKAKSEGKEETEFLKEKAKTGYDEAKQSVYRGLKEGDKTLEEVKSKAYDPRENGYEDITKRTREGTDKLKIQAQEAKEKIQEKTNSVVGTLQEGWEKTKDAVKSLSPSSVSVPGDDERVKTRIGEAVATSLQRKDPINSFHTHICSVECYCGNLRRQVPMHQYVSHLNEDFMQGVIYDSDRADAKLLGVEYIITERLFGVLPPEERKYWHSHAYEVKSGLMVSPRLPWTVEHKLMSDLTPTYGKTILFWHDDPLPFGSPQLLVSPTRDGIVHPGLIHERDQKLGIDTSQERRSREDIPFPRRIEGADSWERGEALQLRSVPISV